MAAKKPMTMKTALAAYEKSPKDKKQDKSSPGYEASAADARDDKAGARAIMKKAKKK